MKPTNKELRKAWDTCYKLLGPWEKFGRVVFAWILLPGIWQVWILQCVL